jgi:ATP-dependent exoDNAse (exonuclease V) beta subunit
MKLAGCIPPELRDHAADEISLERHEAARLLYVAATRARELLVVSALADQRSEGWLAALNPAIYPPEERQRTPQTASPPGCPHFGAEATLCRPANAAHRTGVSPGQHRPEAGGHTVTWWDPSALELGVQEATGLAQQKLLQADEHDARAEAAARAYADWLERRSRVTAEGSVPSRRIRTATEHAAQPPDGGGGPGPREIPIETVPGSRSGSRPHGTRFGTLVHSLLAIIDLDAGRGTIERTAQMHARLLGAPPEEAAAAADAVSHALEHPLLRRAAEAARAGRCRREAAIAARLPDGTILTGIADLAFFEEGPRPVWTVLDFKTDVDLAPRLEEYRRQVAAYADAIARATGQETRAILLRV